MIQIDLLKNNPHAISALASIVLNLDIFERCISLIIKLLNSLTEMLIFSLDKAPNELEIEIKKHKTIINNRNTYMYFLGKIL